MTEQLYRIRPLVWARRFSDYDQVYEAGHYAVRRVRGDCEKHENCQVDSHGKWQPWRWEYCFCEYYDESTVECATAKDGKAAAEAERLSRLLPELEAA